MRFVSKAYPVANMQLPMIYSIHRGQSCNQGKVLHMKVIVSLHPRDPMLYSLFKHNCSQPPWNDQRQLLPCCSQQFSSPQSDFQEISPGLCWCSVETYQPCVSPKCTICIHVLWSSGFNWSFLQNCYKEFHYIEYVWYYLANQRCTSQAHGINAILMQRHPSSLTVQCPACPKIGVNIDKKTIDEAKESETYIACLPWFNIS